MKLNLGFSCALFILLFFPSCSKEPELKEQKTNPRIAKSGKKLVEGEEASVAPNSSSSLDSEPKLASPVKEDGISEPAQPAAPTQQEMQELIRRAKAGDANAQVDLGNIHFAGLGVPVNKKAAEFFWRNAAKAGHSSAVANLQMLYTKPEEGVSFFGANGKGERFVYLVDSSGSMGMGMRFQKEKKELIRSIRTLKPHMKFTVIFYDDVPHHNGPFNLYDATERNIRLMVQWVTSRGLGHNNYMIPALKEAMILKPDTIFLLSDGMPDFKPDRVCADVRKLNPGQKVVVHAVSLHDSKGRLLMKRIAEENNGEFRYVAPDKKLGER